MGETIAAVGATVLRVSKRTAWIFVEVFDGEGRVGTGEATLHYEQDRIRQTVLAIGAAIRGRVVGGHHPELVCTPAMDLPDIAARCGIDQALHDLEGQRLGRPIFAGLSGHITTRLPVYANINRRTADRSAEGFARSAGAAVSIGLRAVKIAPFDDVQPRMSMAEARPLLNAAYDRIAAVRGRIGDGIRLQVDCHWRLGMHMINEALGVCAENDIFWLETPISEDEDRHADIVEIRRRANRSGIRLAGAELKTGEAGFGPIVRDGLYDVIMPDLIFVGGYAEYRRVSVLAERYAVAIAPHNPTGPILHAHSVQASAATPGFLCLEMQFDESPAFKNIVEGILPMPEGHEAPVPQTLGLGLRLVSERIAANQF